MKSLFARIILLCILFGGIKPIYASSISISYAENSQLNRSNREINNALRKKRILEKIATDLERLYDLPNIHIKTAECRQSNAFYDPNHRTIILCLEIVENARQRAKMVSNKLSERALLVGGSIRLVLEHELGHAMAHVFKLPITGREEDFADQVSLFTLLHTKGSQYGVSAAMLIHNGNDNSLADTHSLDTQRRISVICWAWGFSSKDFDFVAEKIPEYRKSTCVYEYEKIDFAMRFLLGRHLKIQAL